ncbi:MAG: RIO1 family regulatory kinase/ATPase [Candidatus Thorarchaeota archaeon]
MPGVVEKLNPNKPSALSVKRSVARAGRSGRLVKISEVRLEEVRRDAVSFGLATSVAFQLKAGKEASIFLAYWDEHPIILKVYRLWRSSQSSKKRGFYAPGRMEVLAAKEYDVLLSCFRSGMHVPTPIGRVGNYLTMRYIGDSSPAPQLRTVELGNPEEVLDEILDEYLLMYSCAHYVHGDLSGYNILWWKGRPWIIDVPQAYHVGPWADMDRVVKLLRRDITNVLAAFGKYGIQRDSSEIVETFLSEYVPRNLRNFREAGMD